MIRCNLFGAALAAATSCGLLSPFHFAALRDAYLGSLY